MNRKTLKPLTIVPSTMYIERKADRQLKRILMDMGRPGYVLVARQMGKTNLLLNAKREYDSSENIFSYLDVSNQFPDLRSFFRNVIDTVIETSQCSLNEVWGKILSARTAVSKLPHKEHESELREILHAISGNLIVCFDEIDALTKSNYSDQVFSFIRSIYFSGRSNFSEFNRITYVLSGVAEPADIIKNKDISPFNIGEKIYLEDFSYEEASQLIGKSSLPYDKSINDRIFDWANGHPRITWDIGSELEDMLSSEGTLTVDSVDQAAKRLYFSEIDNPPVDHIRRLAEENQELRDALVSIHYGRSESLSESIRTKLYLAGITRVAPRKGSVLFKNRIVEESLSESFLLSLPTQSANDSLERGIAEYDEGNYAGAISHFKAAIKSSPEVSLANALWLARAFFYSEEFEEVKNTLHEALDLLKQDVSSDQDMEVTYLAGATFLRLGLYKDAIDQLSAIIDHERTSPYYFEAAVDYLEASLSSEERNSLEKQEILCKRLISERAIILGQSPKFRSQTELFALLHLSYAKILLRRRLNEQAAAVAFKGVEFASLNTKIKLLITQYDASTTNSKQNSLHQCIALLRQCKGFAESVFGKNEIIEVKSLYELLSRLSLTKRFSDVNDVFSHIILESKAGLSESSILSLLCDIALETGDNKIGSSILEASLSIVGSNITLTARRKVLRAILLTTPAPTTQYARKYFETFNENNPVKIEDIVSLNNIAIGNLGASGVAIAIKSIGLLKDFLLVNISINDAETSSISLLVKYLETLQSFTSHPSSAQLASARALFSKISSHRQFFLPGFQANHPKLMQSNLSSILKKYGSLPNIKGGQKIGRNEIVTVKYEDTRQFGKFKKFELDIETGACDLIGKGTLA